jgi:hypothetical protein
MRLRFDWHIKARSPSSPIARSIGGFQRREQPALDGPHLERPPIGNGVPEAMRDAIGHAGRIAKIICGFDLIDPSPRERP